MLPLGSYLFFKDTTDKVFAYFAPSTLCTISSLVFTA